MSEKEEGNYVGVRERSSRFYKRAIARVFSLIDSYTFGGERRFSFFSTFSEKAGALLPHSDSISFVLFLEWRPNL